MNELGVRRWVSVLAMVAAASCGPPSESSSTSKGIVDTSTAPEDTSTSDTSTPITSPPAIACEANPRVTALTVTQGLVPTSITLSVAVDPPAPVVARCVSDTDAEHVFFAESLAEQGDHALSIWGLAPSEAYTCTAAPACLDAPSAPAAAAYTPGAPPSELQRLVVQVDPDLGMTGAWTLAPVETNTQGAFVVVWDATGGLRWWWPLPPTSTSAVEALALPGTQTLVVGGGMLPEGRVRRIDMLLGETYAWAPAGWESTVFHHDAKQLPDGRLLTLELSENTQGGLIWDGFRVRVHDPDTGVVDIDIDSQRYADDGTLPLATVNADPYHANWVDLSPDGEVVYVSLCAAQTILALEAATGDVLWHLGRDRGWTVRDGSGQALTEGDLPQCQHGLEVYGRDHLLVYDNGRVRQQSMASEWVIDGVAKVAERRWSWTEPGWGARFLGDIDDLGNDRVLLTQAQLSMPSDFVEVDQASGRVASRMTLGKGNVTYRAERYAGCALFSDAVACPDLAERHALYEALLTP